MKPAVAQAIQKTDIECLYEVTLTASEPLSLAEKKVRSLVSIMNHDCEKNKKSFQRFKMLFQTKDDADAVVGVFKSKNFEFASIITASVHKASEVENTRGYFFVVLGHYTHFSPPKKGMP